MLFIILAMKVTNYKVQKVGNAMNMDFGPVLDLLVKVRDNCDVPI